MLYYRCQCGETQAWSSLGRPEHECPRCRSTLEPPRLVPTEARIREIAMNDELMNSPSITEAEYVAAREYRAELARLTR